MQSLAEHWKAEGYIVIPGLFDARRTQLLGDIVEHVLETWRRADPQTGSRGDDDATSMRHLNHPVYFVDHPEWFVPLMDAIANPKVLDIVRTILGEEPMFRCTSLFMNPLRTSRDGNWHRDSQFVTQTEEEEKAMILVSGPESGGVQLQIPLVPSEDIEYVPRSHLRWDTHEEYEIRRADGGKNNTSPNMPSALRIPLQAGDAAAFNSVGLHRGRYHADKLRRTFMLTFTPASRPVADYFSDQPWFAEPDYLARLSPATRRFFEPFVDEYAGFWKTKPSVA